jgi:hypothetical protein
VRAERPKLNVVPIVIAADVKKSEFATAVWLVWVETPSVRTVMEEHASIPDANEADCHALG